MKYAAVFLSLGIIYAIYSVVAVAPLLKFLSVSCAIAFCGVGLAYWFGNPKFFFKNSEGRLSFLSYILFWPYHVLNFIGLWIFRLVGHENAYDKITEQLYLGCKLSNADKKAIKDLGIVSVLDLTCEFTEPAFLRQRAGYLCIPVLDTRAPSAKQLKETAAWIEEQMAKGPVYVHCAFGHSRGATFVAAYLLQTKQANTIQDALNKITAARPKVHLSPSQLAALKQLNSV